MITKKEAIIINNKTMPNMEEILYLITRYIFDLKNLEVNINLPTTPINTHLFHAAHISAADYYNKFN